VAVLSVANVEDKPTQRALEQTKDAVQALQSVRKRDVVMVDLVVGTNIIRHGLGRDVTGYTLVPTVADATFAHALDETNPNPQREVWILVVGVAQPRARLEVW
jgi:hypothetical protein